MSVLVNATQEDLLVLVLEGEVQGLCGEVTDDIGEVTTPESSDSLFLGDTDEAVDNTYKSKFEIHETPCIKTKNIDDFSTEQTQLEIETKNLNTFFPEEEQCLGLTFISIDSTFDSLINTAIK